MDESPALMEVKQTLRNLTTALAMMATHVEQLYQGKASQVTTMSAQPGTSAGGNPPCTLSAGSSDVSPALDQGWGQPRSYPFTAGPHGSPAWDQGWGQRHCHC